VKANEQEIMSADGNTFVGCSESPETFLLYLASPFTSKDARHTANSDFAMVTLSEVQSTNSFISSALPPDLVAVFARAVSTVALVCH
jgi:hypothetical protein